MIEARTEQTEQASQTDSLHASWVAADGDEEQQPAVTKAPRTKEHA